MGQLGSDFGNRQSNQSSTPAQWVENASQRGVEYAEGLYNQPYQGYNRTRVAGLSPNEIAAGRLAGQDRHSPWIERSGAAYARGADVGRQSAADRVGGYINPYRREVLDVANESMARDYQQRQNQLRGQAASRGAFGGARQNFLEQRGTEDFLKQQSDLYTGGMSDAYDRAMQAAQSDLSREQQGAFGEAAGYGGLASSAAGLTNDQIRAMLATGESERSVEQGRLDTDYESYLREQGLQREDLDRFLASIRAGDYSRTGTGYTDSSGSWWQSVF